MTNDESVELQKLRAFYNKVRELTANHGVINDHAIVTARNLGDVLSEVDSEWHKAQYKMVLSLEKIGEEPVELAILQTLNKPTIEQISKFLEQRDSKEIQEDFLDYFEEEMEERNQKG